MSFCKFTVVNSKPLRQVKYILIDIGWQLIDTRNISLSRARQCGADDFALETLRL